MDSLLLNSFGRINNIHKRRVDENDQELSRCELLHVFDVILAWVCGKSTAIKYFDRVGGVAMVGDRITFAKHFGSQIQLLNLILLELMRIELVKVTLITLALLPLRITIFLHPTHH